MRKSLLILSIVFSFLIAIPAYAQDVGDDAIGGALGIGMLCCWGIFAIVFLALFVFWIFMLIDCIKRPEDQFPNAGDNTKTIWLVILIVSWFLSLNWLAAIIYYFMVKKKMPL